MASFVRGVPVATSSPTVVVDDGLKVGRHRFTLVVVDDGGRESVPDALVVEVSEIVLTPIDPLRPVAAVRKKPRSRSTP